MQTLRVTRQCSTRAQSSEVEKSGCRKTGWCRGTPLEGSSFSRLALTHLSAAVVAGGIWVAVAKGLGLALATVFPGLEQQIARDYPLIFGSGVLLYLLAVALHYVLLSDQASH